MRSHLSGVVVVACTGAAVLAAFAAGRWSAPAAPAATSLPTAHTPDAPWAPPSTTATPMASGLTIEDVRLVVRQEIAAALEADRAPPPAPADASRPDQAVAPGLGFDERAAADQVQAILDGAISRKRFTAADRDQWVEQLERLPPSERFEALRKLSMAINRDQLALEPGAFPTGPGANR